MKKIDMYQEVPEQFHNKLCDTLDQLEEKKVVKFSAKKYVAACAAVLLAVSTITVGAVELFQWHQAASERFETNKELENKLTNQGVAIPAEDSYEAHDITIKALQAINMDKNFYLLAAFEWPKELQWNEDILFEETEIISGQEFYGCTANLAGEPDENGMVYIEIDVHGNPEVDYLGEIKIRLSNLIQTAKTAYVDTLVEAEWELAFDLPMDADTRSFQSLEKLPVNIHDLQLDKIEIGPFSVKIYTEEEMARHATYFSNIQLTAVEYEDGSIVETYGNHLKIRASKDEDGTFYFNLPLDKAVDVDKVRGLVFNENNLEFTFALDERVFAESIKSGNSTEADDSIKPDYSVGMGHSLEAGYSIETSPFEAAGQLEIERMSLYNLIEQQDYYTKAATVSDFQILYVRHNNVILTDSNNIYLWDAQCDSAKIIMKLKDYGYDAQKGGDIAMMPGGAVLAMYPVAGSSKVYMLAMDNFEVVEAEADAEKIWPVPRYEDYKNSFFKVSDSSDLPNGTYSVEGYETQGSAYVLYSSDGSIENMELVDMNGV